MSNQVVVGIADMKMCRMEGTLITYALGSCIGICFYDPVIKLATMIHIMLPEFSGTGDNKFNEFKYANTGIAETLRKMAIFGAVKRRLVCKIAGGAKMFDIKGGNESIGNIGQRNIDAVKRILAAEGIAVKSSDVGLNYARTMILNAETGEVTIRVFGKPEKTL